MKIAIVEQLDRGIAYGEACFETFRVINRRIFAWPGHMARLTRGLSEFGIVLADEDKQAMFALCLEQAERVGSDVLVRLTVSGGEAAWGLLNKAGVPSLSIQVMPFVATHQALTLSLKSWPFALQEKPAKFAAHYADTLRALRGSNDINVLFERDGLLIAAATANLLIYRNSQWWTPKAGAGVLPGMIRDFLIKNGIVEEAVCPVSWLEDCEAVALCNSGQFIRPVCGIDAMAFDAQHPAIASLKAVFEHCDGVKI